MDAKSAGGDGVDGGAAKRAHNDSIKHQLLRYSSQLDAKNDFFEALARQSRDLTSASKKFIFAAHRVFGASMRPGGAPPTSELPELLSALQRRFGAIHAAVVEHARSTHGGSGLPFPLHLAHCFERFRRAYSPGLQEFVEGACFFAYLKDRRLPAHVELLDGLRAALGELEALEEMIPLEEFALGVLDVSGELMRISLQYQMAGDVARVREILQCMEEMVVAAAELRGRGRGFQDKIKVLKESCIKVETNRFNAEIRGRENLPFEMVEE